ncbi:hypothetical protein GCM10011316_13270 [Roseibium aquae]|uniref:Uncharacterized protein n=1 Tax=Roseibium aquae TaxID=1323746 RepID=A0A916THW0_9HYPH|nr:hypothetical protein [Roseibium aquae]GGB42708.1 hypothetical protein GCM10011316_13270 [Roseibium aquae]
MTHLDPTRISLPLTPAVQAQFDARARRLRSRAFHEFFGALFGRRRSAEASTSLPQDNACPGPAGTAKAA